MEINEKDVEFHLDVLGQREVYCLVAKNYRTRRAETVWLARSRILDYVRERNASGAMVWISINTKNRDNDSNEGVSSLDTFFIDKDSERPDKKIPATEVELLQAFEGACKIIEFLEKEYGAKGFLACSGNGWHIDFPLPKYALPTLKLRDEINARLKNFAEDLGKKCGIKMDSIFDLRRCETLIGSLNLKIFDQPRQTYWYKTLGDPTLRVGEARKQNEKLLAAILNVETTMRNGSDVTGLEPSQIDPQHALFEILKETDAKLKNLHEGVYSKKDFKSRSEAEQSLLVKLVMYGFSDEEIYSVMATCKIGKWQERSDDYRPHSIGKARKFVANLPHRKTFIQLDNLAQIENPLLANKLVEVHAIVSSTSTAYCIPSEFVWIDAEGESSEPIRIEPDDTINLRIIDSSSHMKYKILASYGNAPETATIRDTKSRTYYKLRVRPPISSLEMTNNKIFDEKGCEYKPYDIYIASEESVSFTPSSLMKLCGRIVPDPKRQTVTLLAIIVEFPEEICGFNIEPLNILRGFFMNMTTEERVTWILDNFERYSRIVNRRNIALGVLLDFYSPLTIDFDGEKRKCWGNTDLMGDTTTAKTETVRKVIRLLKAGAIITAETASHVGLLGTAVQIGKEGWMVDWGFLPLYDRKLLCIDGAQKLPRMEWSTMDEAERSGTVVMAKAGRGRANARTRQIKINNPVDPDRKMTRSMDNFVNEVESLGTVFNETSIARLDIAVFSNSADVNPEEINKELSQQYDERLDLLGESLKWVWDGKFKVEFTKDALDTILGKATELYEAYYCSSVPLVAIDIKYKLAKLSADLACLTLSTDEKFKTVTVTKAHVDYIVDFLEDEYSRVGLDKLAQEERVKTITDKEADAMIKIIAQQSKIDQAKILEILGYIARNVRVTREDLAIRFELSRDLMLSPLISALKGQGLTRVGKGQVATAKLVRIAKILQRRKTTQSTSVGLGTLDSSKKDSPENDLGTEQQKENSTLVKTEVPNQPKPLSSVSLPTDEWEDFHTVGRIYPDEAWKKTVQMVREFPQEMDRMPTVDDLREKLRLWWSDDSIPFIIERLEKSNITPASAWPDWLNGIVNESDIELRVLSRFFENEMTCPICGRSICETEEKIEIPGVSANVYAHDTCYKVSQREGKHWCTYAGDLILRLEHQFDNNLEHEILSWEKYEDIWLELQQREEEDE